VKKIIIRTKAVSGYLRVWRCCVVFGLLCSLPFMMVYKYFVSLKSNSKTLFFFRKWRHSPSSVGAVFPSSVYLSRKLAHLASTHYQSGWVVELGAGLGAITHALTEAGVPPGRLIAVEQSTEMVDRLRLAFPDVHVVHGGAEELSAILSSFCASVEVVVSSLPIRLWSKGKRAEIFSQISHALGEHGIYLQYTYAITERRNLYPDSFALQSSKIVWRNLPPAKVDCLAISSQ